MTSLHSDVNCGQTLIPWILEFKHNMESCCERGYSKFGGEMIPALFQNISQENKREGLKIPPPPPQWGAGKEVGPIRVGERTKIKIRYFIILVFLYGKC